MASFRDFLDYAEGFYATARQASKQGQTRKAESSIIASLLLSWIAIESFINSMLADFASLPPDMFSLPERALLMEKALEFMTSGKDAGLFCVSRKTEYKRLEDKIMFLIARFGKGSSLDKGGRLWQKFIAAKERRDQITHHRKSRELSLTLDDAADALEVAKSIIRMVSERVWGKAVNL